MRELDLTRIRRSLKKWGGGARGVYAEKGSAYRVLLEKPNARDKVEDVGVGGRLLLKWILK